MRKGNIPKTEPFQDDQISPIRISWVAEVSISITANYFLLSRYDMNQSFATPVTPVVRFLISISWSTISKAFWGQQSPLQHIWLLSSKWVWILSMTEMQVYYVWNRTVQIMKWQNQDSCLLPFIKRTK